MRTDNHTSGKLAQRLDFWAINLIHFPAMLSQLWWIYKLNMYQGMNPFSKLKEKTGYPFDKMLKKYFQRWKELLKTTKQN